MVSKGYRDLLVWQEAIDLVEAIYSAAKQFPKHEIYGLTNQMQRCAVSIPSNIAEEHGRNSSSEFRRFLYISLGSLAELDTQLEIARRLGYIELEESESIMKKSLKSAECCMVWSTAYPEPDDRLDKTGN